MAKNCFVQDLGIRISKNGLTGTLFERPPWAQKRSKFKNFGAHHQANDQTSMMSTEKVQKSYLGPKLWAFEKRAFFWEICTPLRTFSCFHFHYELFFAISFPFGMDF